MRCCEEVICLYDMTSRRASCLYELVDELLVVLYGVWFESFEFSDVLDGFAYVLVSRVSRFLENYICFLPLL